MRVPPNHWTRGNSIFSFPKILRLNHDLTREINTAKFIAKNVMKTFMTCRYASYPLTYFDVFSSRGDVVPHTPLQQMLLCVVRNTTSSLPFIPLD